MAWLSTSSNFTAVGFLLGSGVENMKPWSLVALETVPPPFPHGSYSEARLGRSWVCRSGGSSAWLFSLHLQLACEVESWFCFLDKCLSGCLSLRPAVGRVEISQYCPAVSSAVLRGANSPPRDPEKAKEKGTLTQT